MSLCCTIKKPLSVDSCHMFTGRINSLFSPGSNRTPPSLARSSKCGAALQRRTSWDLRRSSQEKLGTRLEMARERNTTVLLLYFSCTTVQASGCMQDPEWTITALQFLLLGTEQSWSVSLC